MKSATLKTSNPSLPLVIIAAFAIGELGVFNSWSQDAARSSTNEWVAPPRMARRPNPISADEKSLKQGAELFVAGCLPCHGPAGKGDGSAAATLERDGKPIRPGNLSDPKLWLQSDGTIFWKISEGRSPMPSFQETFSEEQRWQIVNYVRTLAPHQGNNKQEAKLGGK